MEIGGRKKNPLFEVFPEMVVESGAGGRDRLINTISANCEKVATGGGARRRGWLSA